MMITGRSACVLANMAGRWPLLLPGKEAGSVPRRDAGLRKAPPPKFSKSGFLLTPVAAKQEENKIRAAQ